MLERTCKRYSLAFQRQVVLEIESGRFASQQAAREHYEIGGAATIPAWLRKFGKNQLLAKVVRVQAVDEADQIVQLRRQVAELERALGRTQAENLLNQSYLKLACERLGVEVDAFRKKSDGKRSTTPRKSGR